MRVAWFPKSSDLAGNPYWELLQQALEDLGIEFETSHSSYWMQRRWLLNHRGRVHVLHFHFIQPHYVLSEERVALRRLMKFASDLALARFLGYRIIWTMHDLMPTWPKEPRWVECLARYVIAWMANDVIVHCNEAQRLLKREFRRSARVWVLPLPSYADVHPNQLGKEDARRWLGIDDDRFVVAFIGGIRPNKGIEELIAAFVRLADSRAALIIAGRPWPPEAYVKDLVNLSATDSRILLRAQTIPDEEMQYYINAADIVAFPFKQVLTSSSVMLAISFGRPVIVPRIGCLPELVGDSAGIFYDPADPVGLLDALRQARQCNLSIMGNAAFLQAKGISWKDLAMRTRELYMAGVQ